MAPTLAAQGPFLDWLDGLPGRIQDSPFYVLCAATLVIALAVALVVRRRQ